MSAVTAKVSDMISVFLFVTKDLMAEYSTFFTLSFEKDN
jgi:hypothetical protein